jgi:hypothetical protein
VTAMTGHQEEPVDAFHYYAVSPDVAANLSTTDFYVWTEEEAREAEATRSFTPAEPFVIVAAKNGASPNAGEEVGTYARGGGKDPPKPPLRIAGESIADYRARFEIVVPPRGFRG